MRPVRCRQGGKEAFNDKTVQAVYQSLLAGGEGASKTAAGLVGSGDFKDYLAYTKGVREQAEPHIEAQARLLLKGREGDDRYKDLFETTKADIFNTQYRFSNELKTVGLDPTKLSRHPETYREIAEVSARYVDARNKTQAYNKERWFGFNEKELPNMANFMFKEIAINYPATAGRLAIMQAQQEIGGGDRGKLISRADELVSQWKTQKTFMDEE